MCQVSAGRISFRPPNNSSDACRTRIASSKLSRAGIWAGRWKTVGADDYRGVSGEADAVLLEPEDAFLAVYERALPYVYGYLLARCRRAGLAEELTAETMLAAVD